MRLIHRLAALLLPTVFALGCSNYIGPTDNHNQITGKFTLVSVDEQTLPATVFDGIVVADPDPFFHLRIIATSGTFTLDANGHYEHRVEHDAFVNGTLANRANHVDRGECTRSGTQLQCSSSFIEGVEFNGTIAGSTITITQDIAGEGDPATYRYSWTSSV